MEESSLLLTSAASAWELFPFLSRELPAFHLKGAWHKPLFSISKLLALLLLRSGVSAELKQGHSNRGGVTSDIGAENWDGHHITNGPCISKLIVMMGYLSKAKLTMPTAGAVPNEHRTSQGKTVHVCLYRLCHHGTPSEHPLPAHLFPKAPSKHHSWMKSHLPSTTHGRPSLREQTLRPQWTGGCTAWTKRACTPQAGHS